MNWVQCSVPLCKKRPEVLGCFIFINNTVRDDVLYNLLQNEILPQFSNIFLFQNVKVTSSKMLSFFMHRKGGTSEIDWLIDD